MRVAIVLAAGASRRFGRPDKLLARIGGKPVLSHALAGALAAPVARVVVVVPSAGGRVARLARAMGRERLRVVVARDCRRGLGASLRAGLRATRPIEREAAIFLGDMPGAHWPRGLRMLAGVDAVRPVAGGVPGHPLLVRTAVARAKVRAEDQGLGPWLQSARVALIRAEGGSAADIDTVAALRRARWARTRRG